MYLPKLLTRAAALSVLLPALSANAGCSRYTHTKQCRALIAQVNPALDEVVRLTRAGGAGGAGGTGGTGGTGTGGAVGSGGASGKGYIAAAERYEVLAKRLGPMEFGSEEMAKYVAEYVGLLNGTAQNLRTLAGALEAGNTVEADKTNRELERIATHERSVVARMDNWCQP